MRSGSRGSLLILLLALGASSVPGPADAKLKIVTTTTDLRALAAEIGGAEATTDSIAKGTQDPHFIEAKPSFMVKVSRADLIVANGLDLEIGWLPSILRGGRNPKVVPGQKGYLEVGPLVDPLEVPEGKITRAEGDVHPSGNPHVTLDPIRMGTIALKIADRLGELDPANTQTYQQRAKALQSRLNQKSKLWKERIQKSGVTQVVTYHKTLNYFLNRFGIEPLAILEPKPGIPPTGSHILKIIQLIRERKVPLILVENYFDPSVTRKIVQEVPSVRVRTVPVSIDGEPEIRTLDDLYESLVKAVESASK